MATTEPPTIQVKFYSTAAGEVVVIAAAERGSVTLVGPEIEEVHQALSNYLFGQESNGDHQSKER